MVGIHFSNLRSILCLGAHGDDLEIGAGATVLKLIRNHPDIHVAWVVFSAPEPRAREARGAASELLAGARASEVILHEFPDSYFPHHWADIKDVFEKLKENLNPDLVITHNTADRHQDHQVVGQLTWNTFRNQQILEYEIPKYDGDLGQPNLFVPASIGDAERKIEIIKRNFKSQSERDWFDDSTFRGLMRIRGLESRAPDRLAEAFFARKVVLT